MRKKIISIFLAVILCTCIFVVPASAAALTATPTSSTVLVNGKSVAFDAYNIDGNNYFKLRDLAYVLNGTVKQFSVGWDGAYNAITLTSGNPYTALGNEMESKGSGRKTPTPTSSKIFLNGREVRFTAYNIEGNNYFKLRDIGQTFNFGVDWDGSRNTIVIDTSKRYANESGATSYSASYFGAAQGSAKILEGRTLLVSIFLSSEKSSWNSQDIDKTLENLDTVKSFIEAEGKKYGKEIDIIYDYNKFPDLYYNMRFDGNIHEYPADGYTDDTVREYVATNLTLDSFIENSIPYLALAEKYKTDSITYCIFKLLRTH